MKKRVLSALLILVVFCALLPQTAIVANAETYSGKCGDNVTWELNTDTGVLHISGTGDMFNYFFGTPWENYSVKGVIIDDGITSICDKAFSGCTGLTNVTIPNGVTSIGREAFYSCTGLTSITIPDSVTSIGVVAFKNCTELILASIGSGVSVIERGLFANCSKLGSIIFSDSVTSIKDNAFMGCIGLTSIAVSDSVTYVENGAFDGCNVKELIITPGSKTINHAMVVCRSTLKKVTIPDSVTCIDQRAFFDCTGLTSVIIPDSVTSIKSEAFRGCINLKSVTIPGSVISIDGFAFSGCTWLTSVTISNGVTSIGREAFNGCTGLRRVTIPRSVTSIGREAFKDCVRIENVYYNGSSEQWNFNVYIDFGNSCLENAVIHFRFSDVADGAFYAEAVAWAVSHDPQVTNGMSNTTFAPGAKCTRAQVVTFLWRAAGCPEPTSSNNPFADVKSGAYYYKAVLWAVEKGVTSGVSATKFAPNNECTRGQVVTFLWRAKDKPVPTQTAHKSTDVDAKGFYYNAMLWAVETGVTNGMSDTKFAPNNTCTRGQVVTFLYRAFK